MRGTDKARGSLLSYIDLEEREPARRLLQYNLLFRWFLALGVDDPDPGPAVFSRNRERLLNTGMSRKVMAAIPVHREVRPLL